MYVEWEAIGRMYTSLYSNCVRMWNNIRVRVTYSNNIKIVIILSWNLNILRINGILRNTYTLQYGTNQDTENFMKVILKISCLVTVRLNKVSTYFCATFVIFFVHSSRVKQRKTRPIEVIRINVQEWTWRRNSGQMARNTKGKSIDQPVTRNQWKKGGGK